MIIHLVLYEPRHGITEVEVDTFRAILLKASRTITSIRQVRVGRTVDLGIGYETRSTGQTFQYFASFEFDSVEGLNDYLGHSSHAALAEQFWKHCERTMILDIEAEDPKLLS